MPPRYGSLSVLDTLAKHNNTNVIQFGEEQLAGYLNIILAAHEELIADLMRELGVGTPPDRETTYGVNMTAGEMVEVDEFGLVDAQKIPFEPSAVAFPLRRTQYALQWTRDYLAFAKPLEIANQVLGATVADEQWFYKQLRKVMLRAVNTTVIDRLGGDNRQITVRALVNGDSQGIPPHAVTAATFNPATHTHYLATASFVEANLIALIETVREHGLGGTIRVYVNQAQESAIRGFSGFEPYLDARIVYGVNADRASQTTSQVEIEDRAIGIHGPAEIWVKPWMPPSYLVANAFNANGDPVIGWRKPEGAYARYASLSIAAELDRYPLHAQVMQRIAGFGIWNRIAAAALYTGGGSYVSYVEA